MNFKDIRSKWVISGGVQARTARIQSKKTFVLGSLPQTGWQYWGGGAWSDDETLIVKGKDILQIT